MPSASPCVDYVNWSSIALRPELFKALERVKGRSVHEKISVYEGFGSFHSENVEDLMAQDDSEYKRPANFPIFAGKILCRQELVELGAMRGIIECPLTTVGFCRRGIKRLREPASPNSMPDACAVSNTSESSNADGASPCNGQESVDSDSDSAEESDCRCHWMRPELANEQAAAVWKAPVVQCAMGAPFRKQYFSITPSMTFINHGAFGSALVGALAIKHLYEQKMEREVVDFMDRQLLPLIVHSIRSISSFFHADPRQVVLVQNATFALNCAMQLITKDDVVAFLDTEYLSVYKMMWFRCQEVGAVHHELPLSHLLHNEAIMGDDVALTEEICRLLPEGCTTIVVDYVTSTSAVCLPIFTHIVPALRRRGVAKIIVDGAHAPLQLDLNFNALSSECQPTVFVGNLHKWLSAPKAVGFLWVRKEAMDHLHSVVLSHGAGEGLLSEFIWDGTRDYGAYLAIPALVDFWKAQDCDRIRNHCSALLESAAAMLSSAFGSRRVARHAPFMSLVELPEELQDDLVTAPYIQDVLHDVYHIEVPVKRINERFYLRISVFVYNTPEEYAYLREAVLSIADEWASSEERRILLKKREEQKTMQGVVAGGTADGAAVPCDERIRRQGGCGVSGLDPSLKRKKTSKFS